MRFAEIFKTELFSKYGQKAGCYINEIYEIIKLHYKESLEETISDRKINSVLKMLEDDLRVIEFVDGYLVVKDKIYFE